MIFTGYTRSERHKCDGIDGVLEEDEASEMTSHIPNHGRVQTNHEDGGDKGWIPIHQSFVFHLFQITIFIFYHFFKKCDKNLKRCYNTQDILSFYKLEYIN